MDFSDAQHPRLVASYDAPEVSGTCKWININRQYAYLFFSDCIAIISLSNPLAPQLYARLEWDGIVSQSIHDDILYITKYDEVSYLYAYSLSNPLAPQLLDSLRVNNYPQSIACGDGWLVCGSSVVDVVNTTDPANLQISSELHFISGLEYINTAAFTFSGNNLVVGCGYFASVYDFSQEPILRATLSLGAQVSENKGYIHNNRFWCKFTTYDDGSGILGVDISNLDSPQICFSQTYNANGMFRFNMDARLMTLRTNQNAQFIQFSVLDGDSMPSFDLSYPLDSIYGIVSQGDWTIGINSNNFIQILGFNADETAYPLYNLSANNFSYMNIHNDTLLYTTLAEPYQNGLPTCYLVLFDLPSRTQKAVLELGSSEWGGEITLDGDIAYICNKDEGLFVVDISNIEQPALLCFLQENVEYQCAVAKGGMLWVGSGYSIRCYDARQSITPVFLYEIPLYMQTPFIRPYRMLKIENYLYAITFGGYLVRIKLGYDGADEMNIYQTRYSTCTDISKLGAGLLIGSCDGLSVYNIQDPENLKEVAYRDIERVVVGTTGFIVTSYAVNGDRIYVGRGKSLQVLDASTAITFTHVNTPEADQKLSIFPNPGKGRINIICKLPADGETELELYNLRGQKVFAKTYSYTKEGLNLLRMDTRDSAGRVLGSGVYFVRLKQGNHSQTGKLMVVK